MINNKSILITGGTGSFGSLFVKYIVKNYKPKRLIIFSRDELKQYKMQQELPPKK
jgi:UDP-N-acetylglucosamine 4,6-dehydratase|tara:strand:- start:111 stop:275 length:165 start_codon:yes stop_codon:yes gene_type:complete